MTFHKNIVELAKQNDNFRKVVHTGKYGQVVLMCLQPGEDIGDEVHDTVDQALIFVEGSGKAIVAGEEFSFAVGDLVFIDAGTRHNFINTGEGPLKLYTMYAPPNHPADRLQATRAEAMEEEY